MDEAAFADGAVTTRTLQEQFLGDQDVAADAAISEKEHLIFDSEGGHDHDGVNSSPLAAQCVAAEQLVDGAVTEDKLSEDLLSEIIELEQILAIPQVLSVGSAPGSSQQGESFVDIVGHGFGTTAGEVRLLKVAPGAPGEYQLADMLSIENWEPNRIRVRLPEDPTGLFQVVVNDLPLNAVVFNEALTVVRTMPLEGTLTVPEGILIEIEMSTELMIDPATVDDDRGPTPLVLYPGESSPRPLVQELREEPPYLEQPLEIYYGDQVTRMDGEIRLSSDRKTLTFSAVGNAYPFDASVLVKLYSAGDIGRKPVLLADNTETAMDGAAFELRCRIRKQPPKAPGKITIRGARGKDNIVLAPENMISLANHHAVPVQIALHEGALPSEWVLVTLDDGVNEVSEKVPALGDADDLVYVSLDARALQDGQIQITAVAQNTTSSSPETQIAALDPRTGEPVDWVLKDTKIPYVRVHPVRTPTQFDTQSMVIDVEPGSTLTIAGGARPVVVTDTAYKGRVAVEVPLNPNTSNRLRVVAVDPAGNRSGSIATDREQTPLVVVHDDTLPEITVAPVRTPTNQRIIEITGSANEPVTVVATSGGTIASDTANPNKNFRIRFTLAANQQNIIKLVATDVAGNSSPSVTLRITHDDRPPPLVLRPSAKYSLARGDSPTPSITTTRTRITLYGQSEPGATVTLTGHGYRTSTRAGADGRFATTLPFRLMPRNVHDRAENRSWKFTLDAVDPSGNATKQQKTISVHLHYRIPDGVHRHWHFYWWHWRWYPHYVVRRSRLHRFWWWTTRVFWWERFDFSGWLARL
ncbi:hypothetical protein [Haliangium ochraceum]|uniref:hypothetical protein n=1 Tax=Haliangium ochraceum TaxID=80816 RepID=UPI00126A3FD7|nr:hypothetical protein [Haliangium ochraceum]